jgi:sugar phosphate isomerase/epimerase
MSWSLPLGYCTNVHPCKRASDIPQILEQFVSPVRARCGFEIAAGLWLPAAALAEVLGADDGVAAVRRSLDEHGLSCHTLNAFPYSDFHGARVKEQVYLPDWADPRRLEYTFDSARLLEGLLGENGEGSISTLPLGGRLLAQQDGFIDACVEQLMDLAVRLNQRYEKTGKKVRLAIEPEPFCLLETTSETIVFFERLRQAADLKGCANAVSEHVGVCYDVCHQAVEFEDAADAVGRLRESEIRINKVQISCAIQLDDPSDQEARAALAKFAEPRYLHQTMALTPSGKVLRHADLTEDFALNPKDEWARAELWRTHFHVPVDAEHLGVLGTTRAELRKALAAVADLDYQPHLEVETYTWPVLPGASPTAMVDGLARELIATREMLASHQA